MDGGYDWSYTGTVTDAIVDIAIVPAIQAVFSMPQLPEFTNPAMPGNNFSLVSSSPGGAGAGNKIITSLDAISVNGTCLVVAATLDAGSLEFGGVFFGMKVNRLLGGTPGSKIVMFTQ